jgi:hypothetical protein
MTDWQALFNVIIGVLGAAGGWWLNTLWVAMTELQHADKDLADKVGKIEVLVAGDYVRKDEFVHRFDAMEARIFTKLDAIEFGLNSKADR